MYDSIIGFAVKSDHGEARARTFFDQGNCYPAGAARELQDGFWMEAFRETYIKDYVLFIAHMLEIVFIGSSVKVGHMQCSLS
jgi:hypothetical protein